MELLSGQQYVCSCTGHLPVCDMVFPKWACWVTLSLVNRLTCNLIKTNPFYILTPNASVKGSSAKPCATDWYVLNNPSNGSILLWISEKRKCLPRRPSHPQGLFPFQIIFHVPNVNLTNSTYEPFLNSNSSSRQTLSYKRGQKFLITSAVNWGVCSLEHKKYLTINLFHVYSIVILAFQPSEKSYSFEVVLERIHYIDIQAGIEFNMSFPNISSKESLLSL